ncbi:MAG: aminoacetone oxidase family FAD-binding enzyme [Clostridia bacterium]|nr:aminoacetone oxidase family FAD-binding enzyme [Clostridia bacterium]
MKKFDVIIIGAGASGCMCALACKNQNIAIIDAGKSLAKKIMVTGNGRCNLTNKNMNSSYFNTNIDKYLQKFNEKDALRFFESLGLITYSDPEGRVYPISNSAKSVVDVINLALKNKGQFFAGQKVIEIHHQNDQFCVLTDKDEFVAKKVVVATGGSTMQNSIKNLDISFKKFVPSLVPLECSNVKDLNGIKLSNVKVAATTKSGKTASEIGEVLFKEKGLSGIVIFNLSALFARERVFEGTVQIDLLPDMNEKQLTELLMTRRSLCVNVDKFFVGMFQNAVSNEIFMQSKLNTNKNSAKLTNDEIKRLVKTIKCLSFGVVNCYDNNQVFSGGVCLNDLDNHLMSKKVKNLYFAGEVCDVDGVCGGYNLQWAWTSGMVVGECL